MSDKLVRDELLRSHRYQSLSSDTAKLLFLHLLLSTDSLSNAEATTTALSIIMGRTITVEAGSTLLSELADKDLIRMYENDGKRYAHVPRSRQRIRYLNGKHPRPPVGTEDNEIRDLIAKVGLQSDRGQSQVGRSDVVVAVEVKKSQPGNSIAVARPVLRATRLDPKWQAPDDWIDWAVAVHKIDRQRAVRISLSFRDFWIAKPGQGGTKLDWQATWRNWIRKECGE